MGRRGNPPVRVWEEVWSVFKKVSEKHGIPLSDLVSITLLYATVFSPYVISLGIEENYDITREEAKEIALELKGGIENLIRLVESGESGNKTKELIEIGSKP